ncbi:hypothetical protein BJX62DRAFT_213089 [Aspergillus germanicus]
MLLPTEGSRRYLFLQLTFTPGVSSNSFTISRYSWAAACKRGVDPIMSTGLRLRSGILSKSITVSSVPLPSV